MYMYKVNSIQLIPNLMSMMMIVKNIPWNVSVWNVKFDEKQIKQISCLEFIAQWAFYSFIFLIDVMQNV